jgi:hypothetical protein
VPCPGLDLRVAIGVVDPNLAPFVLRPRDDTDQARRQAERVRSIAMRVLAS